MPTPRKRPAEAATGSPRSSKRSRPAAVKVEQHVEETTASPSGRVTRTRATTKVATAGGEVVVAKVEAEQLQEIQTPRKLARSNGKAEVTVTNGQGEETEKVVAKKGKGKVKVEQSEVPVKPETTQAEVVEDTSAKPEKKKRKTKEEKEAEAMPLAPRSTGLAMFIGAHVSAEGGRSPCPQFLLAS